MEPDNLPASVGPQYSTSQLLALLTQVDAKCASNVKLVRLMPLLSVAIVLVPSLVTTAGRYDVYVSLDEAWNTAVIFMLLWIPFGVVNIVMYKDFVRWCTAQLAKKLIAAQLLTSDLSAKPVPTRQEFGIIDLYDLSDLTREKARGYERDSVRSRVREEYYALCRLHKVAPWFSWTLPLEIGSYILAAGGLTVGLILAAIHPERISTGWTLREMWFSSALVYAFYSYTALSTAREAAYNSALAARIRELLGTATQPA
jgi:hypothetical protein